MQKIYNRKLVFGWGILFVLFSIVGGLLSVQDSHAATICYPSRFSCNEAENFSQERCIDEREKYGGQEQGAIWFNTSSNAPTDDGYYSDGVFVSADASIVRVSLRGSVYTCDKTGENYTSYAVRIQPDGQGANDYRLTNLSSTVLNRGRIAFTARTWSAQGSTIHATLDVRGLATNNNGHSDSQEITIFIYRCFSTNGSQPTGSCLADPIPVKVVRAAGYNFNLVPTMTGTPNYSPGGSDTTATITPAVQNTGSTPSSSNVQWQVTNFIVPPNRAIPNGGDDGQTPVQHYGYGAKVINSAVGQTFPAGLTSLAPSSQQLPDLPLGTKVCYGLSVQPFSQSSGGAWRHSAPFCVTIGKSPKVQILGGDLILGRSFPGTVVTTQQANAQTSVTRQQKTYGSWVEYGMLLTGQVSGTGSGSAYAGGSDATSPCAAAALTFANTSTKSSCSDAVPAGHFNAGGTMPDIAKAFPVSGKPSLPNTVSLTNVAAGTYQAPANLTINGGVIAAGKSIIINAPNSAVSITGNITYASGALTSIGQIPQLVIIAKSINVSGNVTNIDSWLIASGTITTCSDVTAINQLSASVCNKVLTVNGPVMAGKLALWRTAGSGTGASSGDPAEVFNFRPDAYLWAISRGVQTGRLTSVYERDLPPRY